jgi:arylsulfatase B
MRIEPGMAALACVALALATCSIACAPKKPEHPNVVILLADDLGFADVGWHAHGDGAIHTPNLDRLAAGGVRLERYYTAPLCSPARAGLLTGRSPLRMGLARNLNQADTAGVPQDERLMSETFHDAGYETAIAGKWHIGHATAEQRPNARGFDHSYGLLSGWIDYTTHRRGARLDWQRDGEELEEPGYSTDLIAREASRRIEERDKSRPLFLYVAFNTPHPPLHVPPNRELSEKPGTDDNRRAYALMVDELDRAVGSILATLEKNGLSGDTIVVFASDNGGNPEFGGRNTPLREGKFSTFEGGIRAPAVFSWPGTLAPKECTSFVSFTDVYPTLAAACKLPPRAAKSLPLDGHDRWPVLHGDATSAPEFEVFGCERESELRWAVLDGTQKLVLIESKSGAKMPAALFDVARDPGETHDLANENAARVKALEEKLAPWKSQPRLPFGRE